MVVWCLLLAYYVLVPSCVPCCLRAGHIPTSVGQLSELVLLRLENNKFEGPVPAASLAGLTKLRLLHLNGNHLDGVAALKARLEAARPPIPRLVLLPQPPKV